jgi:single-stranded DNA-specific DHH superfamily exonuclease
MLRFLMSAKTPYEVLEESNKNFLMHKRFEHINERYQRLLKEAIESNDSSSDVLFFQYGGDLSMSSELSNELSYKFPDKFVVVMYMKGAKANISGRGKNIREKVLKIIGEIEGASGGGHEDAVGAQVKISDVELFRKRFLELVENQ